MLSLSSPNNARFSPPQGVSICSSQNRDTLPRTSAGPAPVLFPGLLSPLSQPVLHYPPHSSLPLAVGFTTRPTPSFTHLLSHCLPCWHISATKAGSLSLLFTAASPVLGTEQVLNMLTERVCDLVWQASCVRTLAVQRPSPLRAGDSSVLDLQIQDAVVLSVRRASLPG